MARLDMKFWGVRNLHSFEHKPHAEVCATQKYMYNLEIKIIFDLITFNIIATFT